MKPYLAKWFGASWETTIIGWIVLICGGAIASSPWTALLTMEQMMVLMGFCGMLKGFGFMRSKDGNVSNAEKPQPASTVTQLPSGTMVRNPVIPGFWIPILLIGFLAVGACAGYMKTDTKAVLMKLSADKQTVLVTGCATMPERHVLLNAVLPALPPQYSLPAAGALAIETLAATDLCNKVQAMTPVPAPFVDPTVPGSAPVDTVPIAK